MDLISEVDIPDDYKNSIKVIANPEKKTLMITHCNCPDRAESVKKMLLEKITFRNVIVMDTRGVSSMYANDGGVIVTL